MVAPSFPHRSHVAGHYLMADPIVPLSEESLTAEHHREAEAADPELAEWCKLVAQGFTERAAATVLLVSGKTRLSYPGIRSRVNRSPVWREILANAHEQVVQRKLDQLEALVDETDPSMAKLNTSKAGVIQWMLKCRDPKRFGTTRTEIEQTGKDGGPQRIELTLADARALAKEEP